jgi:hypothetical protein
MALRALVKTDLKKVQDRSKSVPHLYRYSSAACSPAGEFVNHKHVVWCLRAIIKELPRVMTIYDVDMPFKTAKTAVAYHFRKHSHIEDSRSASTLTIFGCSNIMFTIMIVNALMFRIIGLLIAKGYMELEETLMQWKQKTHLLRLLEVTVLLYAALSVRCSYISYAFIIASRIKAEVYPAAD